MKKYLFLVLCFAASTLTGQTVEYFEGFSFTVFGTSSPDSVFTSVVESGDSASCYIVRDESKMRVYSPHFQYAMNTRLVSKATYRKDKYTDTVCLYEGRDDLRQHLFVNVCVMRKYEEDDRGYLASYTSYWVDPSEGSLKPLFYAFHL